LGLFARKKPELPATAPADQVEAAEAVIEAVAAMLRALGRHVLALDGTPPDTITRRFEEWARHVLLRTPSPGREAGAEQPLPAPRDWPGLQRFVADQRRTEAALVAETVTGLREAARSFVRAMTQLRVAGDGADSGMREQIERLRKAAASSSPVELKREVLVAADALDSAVATRRGQEEAVATELAEKVKDLSQQLEVARKEGGLDGLTRLANRKMLDEVLEETVELATVTREPVCLVMVDLDDFKGINDRFGHAAGDDVLKAVADALIRVVLRQRDLVARYAGDEFCIVLRDCPVATAKGLVQRVADAVRRLAFDKAGERFGVTASFGIAPLVPGDSADSWIERADRALYEVKRSGKDAIAAHGL